MTELGKDQKQAESEVKTFTVSFSLGEIQENISISTNTPSKPSKEQIINQAINYHLEGKIKEAKKYYEYCIDKGFYDYRVFHGYGILLQAQGNLKKAEIITRKAIDLNSDFFDSYFSLGSILKNLRNLEEAEIVLKKAIKISPNNFKAHLKLGDILYELGKTDEAYISEWEGIKKDPSYEFLIEYRSNAKLIKKTAFFIHSLTVFHHFKPVIDVNPNFFELVITENIEEEIIRTVKKHFNGKEMRIRTTKELIDNCLFYERLLSNHAGMAINLEYKKNKLSIPIIKLIGKENIGFMYTAGKLKWTLSYQNKYYDGILCYGPYHEKKLKAKHKVKTAQMGYPRFDNYFKPGFVKTDLIKKFKCNPKKKTIVWLTTWTRLSSVEKYISAISSLRNEYNIVVRPHPLMKEDDPKNYKKLLNVDFNFIDENHDDDNITLFALADLMIFDYGGSMFGSLYLNINFAFLDMKLEAISHKHLGYYSSEDYLKSFFPERIANIDNIKDICKYCLKNPPSSSIIKSLREEFFNTNYQGNSGKRAYDLLISNDWLK